MPPPEATARRALDRPHRAWAWGLLVGVLALLSFYHDLPAEPHFADESAYIAQSYFWDLLRVPDDPAWLEYPAFDLPPLPKYLIGFSLRVAGHRLGGRDAMRAWYNNPSLNVTTPASLFAARLPTVLLGALGCVALYGLGALAVDRRVGFLAAALLILDPLYRLHARRAMSDVPSELFIILTAALGLWAWKRTLDRGPSATAFLLAVAVGICGGLAALAKLNGLLGIMFLGAWSAGALLLPIGTPSRKGLLLALFAIESATAAGVFVALNPFVTARPTAAVPAPLGDLARMNPPERIGFMLRHRVEVSGRGKEQFRPYALNGIGQKAETVLIQGFGRFGPFGPSHSVSTVRFDWSQDWGALVWTPAVAAGLMVLVRRGHAQLRTGRAPTSWALVVQAAVASVTVTAFIPLAWDRYMLSIQPGSALLAATAVVAAFDWASLVRASRSAPREVSP